MIEGKKKKEREMTENSTRQQIIKCCVKYNQVCGTDTVQPLLKGSRTCTQLGLNGGTGLKTGVESTSWSCIWIAVHSFGVDFMFVRGSLVEELSVAWRRVVLYKSRLEATPLLFWSSGKGGGLVQVGLSRKASRKRWHWSWTYRL